MSEDNKNVADTLNDIFDDDPAQKAREKEIARYEKKRQKALEREAKKALKKAKADEAKEEKDAEEVKTGDDDTANVQKQGTEADAAASTGDKTDTASGCQNTASTNFSWSEAVGEGSTEKPVSGSEQSSDEELDEKQLRKRIRAEKKAKKKKAKEEKEVNIVKDLLFLCLYIIVVIAICWVVLTYVGQRTEVSGESMSNTLHSGDTLWIDKLEYEMGSPKRFDVVVFPYGDDDETFYIKRIIGMPGETVYIDEDGIIYINDDPLEGDVYGREPIASDKRGAAAEEITLGEDEYFVLGDNRNNSRDSRVADVGNIHKSDIIGRAVFRFTGGFGKIE